MKKISSIIAIAVTLVFMGGSVFSAVFPPDPRICSIPFTDDEGEENSPSNWCTSCSVGESYDFCLDGTHYHFGCKSNWGACSCDPDSTFSETCHGGCENWECTPGEGCFGGECLAVLPVPATPTDLSPCYGAEASSPVTLKWSNTGGSYYVVYMSAATGANIPLMEATTNSLTVTAEPGQYTWRVKACNSDKICSQDSNNCTFTAVNLPAACNSPTTHFASGCDMLLSYDVNGDGKINPNELTKAANDRNANLLTSEEYGLILSASGGNISNTCSGCGAPVSDDNEPSGNGDNIGGGGGIQNPLRYNNFKDLASAINNFVFIVAIAIAPILFVIGGFMIITAGGDPLKVQKAQKILLFTAIGLGVILLAQAFVAVLRNVIGVEEETTCLPLLFSALGFKLKKRKVE